jgi:hypothetical protein
MPKGLKPWSRDEIEAVATCLTDDLRHAGPRFSIEFTAMSPGTRLITSVPPSEAPIDATVPGCGGFIETPGLLVEDWEDADALPEPVRRMMGSMHAELGEPAETAIALKVDGDVVTWLEFWSGLDHVKGLADMLDQVQDVVMEATHEQWPMCPGHDHELSLRPRGGRVEWVCLDTGAAVARFGELTERLA